MAHSIIYNDIIHKLSIATIAPDRKSATIEPFTTETASTPFVNGSVAITPDSSGLLRFVKID